MRRPLPVRILLLVALSAVVAAAGNALSPAGIPWDLVPATDVRARSALGGLDVVDPAAARTIVTDRSAVILDARSPQEYLAGHVPGARWMPPSAAEPMLRAMREPPARGERILVYCASDACDAALELGLWLRARGYERVGILAGGFEGWWGSGGTVEG